MKKFLAVCLPEPVVEHVLSEKEVQIEASSKEEATLKIQKTEPLYFIDSIVELETLR